MAKQYAHITFDNPASGVYRCDCPIIDKLYKNCERVFSNPDDPTVVYIYTDDDDVTKSEKYTKIDKTEFEKKAGMVKLKNKKKRRDLYKKYRDKEITKEQAEAEGIGEWEIRYMDKYPPIPPEEVTE